MSYFDDLLWTMSLESEYITTDFLESLKEIDSNTIIDISQSHESEEEYYKKVFLLMKKLKELNKNNEIHFAITSLSKFSKNLNYSLAKNYKYFEAKYLGETYTKKEVFDFLIYNMSQVVYETERKKIQYNLSPLEVFLDIYMQVANFKQYNKDDSRKHLGNSLKGVLSSDFAVCEGFSKMLVASLSKLGIDADLLLVKIYNDEFVSSGHARVILKINDEKYGVSGIYIADVTWANMMSDNLVFALMPPEKSSIEKHSQGLTLVDLIFDNETAQEFKYKINNFGNRFVISDNIIGFRRALFDKILSIFKSLDSTFYLDICEKFKKYNINEDKNWEAFLNFVGEYVINNKAKEIPVEVICDAYIYAKNVEEIDRTKDALDKMYLDAKISKERYQLVNKNTQLNFDNFWDFWPYIYDGGRIRRRKN